MSADESWSALGALDAKATQSEMTERFRDLVKLTTDERHERLRSMIMAEYALDEPRLLEFTARRLRSLVDLGVEDGKVVIEGYDFVFRDVPGDMAMRRVSVVQTVAREMTSAEVDALQHIMPSLLGQIPSMRTPTGAEAGTAQSSATPVTAAAAAKKPAWKFWQRD